MRKICCLLLIALPLWAVEYDPPTLVGISPIHIATAKIDGFSEDASGVLENPASLGHISGTDVAFFRASLLNHVDFSKLAFATGKGKHHVGFGYMEESIAGNPITGVVDGRYQQVDSFSFRNWLTSFGYAYDLSDRVTLGASGQFFGKSFSSVKGHHYAVGLGAKWIVNEQLTWVGDIRNLSLDRHLSFDNGNSETVTPRYQTGASYNLFNTYILKGEFTFEQSKPLTSVSVTYQPLETNIVQLMAGRYQDVIANDVRTRATLGVALNFDNWGMSYAMEHPDHVDFNLNHFVGFHLTINKEWW